jgi:Calcineurin-like phosphoesterase
MPGEKLPKGMRRCSAHDHQGERVIPELEFAADAAQSSGYRSQCRTCYNRKARARYDVSPMPNIERSRRGHAAARDKNDSKAEAEITRAEAKARKLAAEREARLKSEVAPLRPDDFSSDDDFDTTVGNVPGQGGVSAAASHGKRQEFNERMADHLEAVRRAAISDATGGEGMVDAMPADDGSYIGQLAEQERRFGNRRLARSISLFSAGEELSRRLWVQACKQYLTGRVVASGYARAPASGRKKRSVCVLLSDLHLGAELLAAENPMPYRKVEEARRLEYILRQVLDYKPQYRKDSELVILLNGDVIEGMLMHDFRDGAPLTEQKVVFQLAMEKFIAECARVYPKVRIYCQPGNHGRDKIRHPGRATSSKWDGHEWQMYYALSRACQNLRNVEWDIPFRAIGKVDLHGSWLLLSHSDTEVEMGHPDTKAKENLATLDKINATRLYGVEFAAAAFGHYHTPRYLPSRPRVIFNGALVPPNGHARGKKYIGEACGQFIWEAVEGYPIGDVRFIEVGRAQDEDERLGSIIKPFRFDLE